MTDYDDFPDDAKATAPGRKERVMSRDPCSGEACPQCGKPSARGRQHCSDVCFQKTVAEAAGVPRASEARTCRRRSCRHDEHAHGPGGCTSCQESDDGTRCLVFLDVHEQRPNEAKCECRAETTRWCPVHRRYSCDGCAGLIKYVDAAKLEAQKRGRITGQPLAEWIASLPEDPWAEPARPAEDNPGSLRRPGGGAEPPVEDAVVYAAERDTPPLESPDQGHSALFPRRERARVVPGHDLVAFETPTECEPCGEVWDAASWIRCPRCHITDMAKVVQAARAVVDRWCRCDYCVRSEQLDDEEVALREAVAALDAASPVRGTDTKGKDQ